MRKEKLEKSAALFAGISVSAFFAFVFYRTPLALPITAPLTYPVYKRSVKHRKEKRRGIIAGQFKEALDSMICALRAGYSAENAVREACTEMEGIYGKKSPIYRELYTVCRGLDSHVPLEQLLSEFADRTKVEAICEFADTFRISKRSGGNMTSVMEQTIRVLQDSMSAEKEVELILAAGKSEQKIMNVIPFFILGYVGVTSKGFFDALYGNFAGAAIMSGCMAVYLFAFVLSEKITDIHV